MAHSDHDEFDVEAQRPSLALILVLSTIAIANAIAIVAALGALLG